MEKCTLDLEGSIRTDDALFVNCVIPYKGGPIGLKRMEEITAVPPREAAIAMMQLTISETQEIRVTIS